MIVGNELHLSISDLFVFNAEKHAFAWETPDVSSNELNKVVSLIDGRYQSMLLMQMEEKKKAQEKRQKELMETLREKERQRKIREEEMKERPRVFSNFQNSYFQSEPVKSAAPTNHHLGADDMIRDYERVLTLVRNSDLLESNPGFIERIKEVEEDIQIYQTSGELSYRAGINIQMMKHALHID